MDEVVVSAASFLVIRLLGQEQERRRKKLPQKRRWWMTTVFRSREIYSESDHSMFRTSAESRLIKARHRPHDSGGLSRTLLMYWQQAEPHEPMARAARIVCLVTCHIVHITREHTESPRARAMWTGLYTQTGRCAVHTTTRYIKLSRKYTTPEGNSKNLCSIQWYIAIQGYIKIGNVGSRSRQRPYNILHCSTCVPFMWGPEKYLVKIKVKQSYLSV
jgi:hypothetical protein